MLQERRSEFALFVITKHGLIIAKKILASLPDCDLFVSKRLQETAPARAKIFSLPMGPILKETFKQYSCHIHIISVGAVVRMIAPLLENKKVDPAIICVDDRSLFTVCVLSGHVGRGNQYTDRVSKILNNVAVITTASDVSKTLTVDILGRDLGWILDDLDRNVTLGCASVVNECAVAFIGETGESNFWPMDKELPKGVDYFVNLKDFIKKQKINKVNYQMHLICTDRTDIQQKYPNLYACSIIYRPKSLVIGLGCDKDVSFEVVEEGLFYFLEKMKLSIKCIKAIATIDLKKNEKAFLKLSHKYHWPIITYQAFELDKVKGVENPSEVVKKYVGTRSVGEAACLLATRADKLLLPKSKYNKMPQSESNDTNDKKREKNMTIAIARIPFLKRTANEVRIWEN